MQIQHKLLPKFLGKLGLPFFLGGGGHSETQEGTGNLGLNPGFQTTTLNLATSCEIKCG